VGLLAIALRYPLVWNFGHIIPDGLNNLMDTEVTVELTPPDLLSPATRAREAASLLATAIARLHSTIPKDSVLALGFSVPERLHTTPPQPGV
jgi:hypothetical protein